MLLCLLGCPVAGGLWVTPSHSWWAVGYAIPQPMISEEDEPGRTNVCNTADLCYVFWYICLLLRYDLGAHL